MNIEQYHDKNLSIIKFQHTFSTFHANQKEVVVYTVELPDDVNDVKPMTLDCYLMSLNEYSRICTLFEGKWKHRAVYPYNSVYFHPSRLVVLPLNGGFRDYHLKDEESFYDIMNDSSRFKEVNFYLVYLQI